VRRPTAQTAAEGGAEEVSSGKDKAARQLNDQEQEQQRYANPRQRVMPHVLLWLTGQKRRDISPQSR
jgi:hypothetical protein